MTAPRHLLVADDDEDIRELLAVVLGRAGFDVATAADGTQALAAATGITVVDAYVLDVRMPDLSGLDVCRRLKSDPRTASRPVLLISAETAESDIAAAYAAGCDDYLAKPFSARELATRVAALLEHHDLALEASA